MHVTAAFLKVTKLSQSSMENFDFQISGATCPAKINNQASTVHLGSSSSYPEITGVVQQRDPLVSAHTFIAL